MIHQRYSLNCSGHAGSSGCSFNLNVNTLIEGNQLSLYHKSNAYSPLNALLTSRRSIDSTGFKFAAEIRYGLSNFTVGPVTVNGVVVAKSLTINANVSGGFNMSVDAHNANIGMNLGFKFLNIDCHVNINGMKFLAYMSL